MKRKISIGILLFLVMITILAVYSSNVKEEANIDTGTNVYFTDRATETLYAEKRALSSTEFSDKIVEVLSYIESGPINTNYKKSFFNSNTTFDNIIESIEINEDTAYLEGETSGEKYNINIIFNDNYGQLSDISKVLIKSSITLSLSEIKGVSNISFISEYAFIPVSSTFVDETINNYVYTKANVVANPIISPINLVSTNFILYFKGQGDNQNLVREERSVAVDPNEPIEKYIVEELIKGSAADNINLIPSNTRLLNVNVDNETVFVDLSMEFVTGQGTDTVKQTLAVYSIVNSLTELEHIESVQILIDAKRYPGFAGDLDLLNQVLIRGSAYIDNIIE